MLPIPARGEKAAHGPGDDGETDDDLGAAPVPGLRDDVDEAEVALLHHARLGGAGAGAGALAEVRPTQTLRHRLHGSQHRRLDQQEDGGFPRGERTLRARR